MKPKKPLRKRGKSRGKKPPPKRGNAVTSASSTRRKSFFKNEKRDVMSVLTFCAKIFLILLIISVFFIGINYILAKQFHLHISEEILRIVFEGGMTKVVVKIIRLF